MSDSQNKDTFKNSYKVQEKEMVSLSVYNVGYQRCEPDYQWGPGVRDHYLIHYIVSGQGYYQQGNTQYHLTSGDVFLIYPYMQVTYYADHNDPWEYYWVGFSGSDAQTILDSTDFSKDSPVIFSVTNGDQIQKQLYRIYENRGNQLSHAAMMTGQLYITLSLFIENAQLPARKQTSGILYVQKAVSYIESHYSYPITIDDVADYVGVSRSHLFREFKQHLSRSPKEYLSEYRIRHACIHLTTTNLSISAIATSVGYDNGMYFSKVFHELKGMTPTMYRKTHTE